MGMNKLLIPLLIATSSAALLLGQSDARPPYRLAVIEQFHVPGSPSRKSTLACTYCHVRDAGGAPWNPFGEAIKKAFRDNPRWVISDALYGVLAQDKDSDGDGFPDALEVFARTLPGDPKSKPSEPLEALQERFLAAGGLGQYKPGLEKPSSDDDADWAED